ncbi:MAG: PilZ domain-containing protein [Pseudomonadota bacterium]
MMELVQTNRRRSPRFSASHKIPAQLVVNGRLFDGTVFDYGVTGLALSVPKAAATSVEKEKAEVEVLLQGLTLNGRVRHSRTQEERAVLGVAFNVPGDGEEVSFTSDDPGWDLIENKETIDQIFRDVTFKGPEVQITVRQIQGLAVLLPEKLSEDGKVIAEIFEAKRGKLTEGRASFQFEMFQTCHAFESKLTPIANNRVEIEIPKTLARLLRRETYRVTNGTNARFLKIRMSSQLLGSPAEEVKVYDYSEHGISVIDPTGWASAPVGTPIENIEITTNEGKTIRGRGTVRGFQWIKAENAYSVGIQYETSSDQDRTEWHNTILEARYPALALRYRAEHHEQIWGLFDRSGYLDLKPREAFTHVFDVTKSTWKKLSAAGTKISKRAVIEVDGKVVGHLQLDRIYPEAWCAHHLAIDPKVSKVVGRELYSLTTDVLEAEGGGFIFSLTEAAKPWNQRNYYDFVKQYRFPEHNELKIFQVYEADTRAPFKLEVSKDVEIRAAQKWDLKRITRFFQLYGTELEREACGLNQKSLLLQDLNAEVVGFGLNRGREFLVATSGSRFLGFARVETGTAGVNIFGLLDMLYIHLMPDLGSQASQVHESLVFAGLARFKELGKDDVIVALDDNRAKYYADRGLAYIWDGVRWIGRCEAARRYHAYTQMLYGHLLTKRAQIRGHSERS